MNTGDMKKDATSNARLAKVQSQLNRLMTHVAHHTTCPFIFTITEGLRTKERQTELVAAGASKTMNSRHLTGHAVDVAIWLRIGEKLELRWDWPLYEQFAQYVQAAADELGIKIVWGGSWKTFKDGPHFELDRRYYP